MNPEEKETIEATIKMIYRYKNDPNWRFNLQD